jgi:ABC-type transport system involved in multi-copper enzyme maturation permease subunit
MLSLVWKDVVGARWILIVALLLYAIQLATLVVAPPASILVTLLFTGLFAFGSIGLEEVQGTDALWCSLPVSRSQFVFARYTTTVVGVLLGLGMSWVVGSVAWSWFRRTEDAAAAFPYGPGTYALMFFVLLGAAALYLPCYFRLGAGRGAMLFSVLVLAILVLASAAGSLIVFLAGGAEALENAWRPDPEELERLLAGLGRLNLIVALTLALVVGSAALAARFFDARDC